MKKQLKARIKKEAEKKFWRESVRSACTPTGEKHFVGYLKDFEAFLDKAIDEAYEEGKKRVFTDIAECKD